MECLYCGTKVGVLRKIHDQQFCCAAHRKSYLQKQDEVALDFLLQRKPQYKPTRAPAPDRGAVTGAGASTTSGCCKRKRATEMSPTRSFRSFRRQPRTSARIAGKGVRAAKPEKPGATGAIAAVTADSSHDRSEGSRRRPKDRGTGAVSDRNGRPRRVPSSSSREAPRRILRTCRETSIRNRWPVCYILLPARPNPC